MIINQSCSCFYQTTFHQKKYSSTKYSLRWLTLEAKSKCNISTNSNYAAQYGVGNGENSTLPPKKSTTNFHRKFFTQGVTTNTIFLWQWRYAQKPKASLINNSSLSWFLLQSWQTQSSLITQHQKHKSSKTVMYLWKISVNVGYPDIWSHEKTYKTRSKHIKGSE